MEFFSSLSRKRLVVVTIIAQVIGFVWYGALFGKIYQQEMKIKDINPEQAKEDMPRLMIMETFARVLYFLGLGMLLTYTPGLHILTTAILYFFGVLSMEWSTVIRSDHSWRLLTIRGGKVAIDTLIAVLLYNVL